MSRQQKQQSVDSESGCTRRSHHLFVVEAIVRILEWNRFVTNHSCEVEGRRFAIFCVQERLNVKARSPFGIRLGSCRIAGANGGRIMIDSCPRSGNREFDFRIG